MAAAADRSRPGPETSATGRRGEGTRAVHTPLPGLPDERPLGLPVYRSAAWAFPDAATYAGLLSGEVEGYSYSRIDNPTSDAFAAAVAALEAPDGSAVGQPFASGMAAISTVLLELAHTGAHLVLPREVYGGTYALCRQVLPKFGVRTTFVDSGDADAVERALAEAGTVALWAETLANPTLRVADLPMLADLAHAAGVPLVVDSTFASPAVCRPLEHGADLVIHSATKYLGGHSDATGGVVVGRPELLAPIRALRAELGPMLAPDEAFLLHRGLATLPVRVARACASAAAVAEGLLGHPAVASVDYPGLAGHRDHALAGKLFTAGRYGAMVTLTPRGGRAAGLRLCDRLGLVAVATSLGGTHSVVSHVASTTHRQLTDADLAAAGIDPGAVRISVGLEDPEDLLADLLQALDGLR